MTKKYGHTWTLFIQRWTKRYKWSYKHEHCIECKWVKFKHKWNWLCTSCHDKKRKQKSDKRKFNLKKQQWKHYYKRRILMFLDKKEKLKTWQKKTDFNEKEYKKQWYNQNRKEVLKLIRKTERMLKKWESCLNIIINWKTKYLPFTEMLEKPSTSNLNDFKKYDEWKEQWRQFDLLKKYYNK